VERPEWTGKRSAAGSVVQERYCINCGGVLVRRVPPDDDRERGVCPACGHVHYVNPKLVVGCVIEHGGRILLCRRAIEPRYGQWTVPAGYLEAGETVADGAMREVREEACAAVEIVAPYVLLDLTFVDQVYLMFRARLREGGFAAGHETLEARLFAEDEVPWDRLAFSAVEVTLRHFFRDRPGGRFPFHTGDVAPQPPKRPLPAGEEGARDGRHERG
jgi:ADP-ribose pyrophosphatase YjhB (NUDIX family)